MGLKTLSEFRTEVKDAYADHGDLTDARVNNYINDAQTRIARAWNFREMKKLSLFTSTYAAAVATDRSLDLATAGALGASVRIKHLRSIRIVTDGKERKLQFVPRRRFDMLDPNVLDNTGTPELYTREGLSTLHFRPVPDQAFDYEVDWIQFPTVLSSDSDTSLFEDKDDIITAFARYYAGSKLGYVQKNDFLSEGRNQLAEAIRQDSDSPDDDALPRAGRQRLTGSTGIDPWVDPFNRGSSL